MPDFQSVAIHTLLWMLSFHMNSNSLNRKICFNICKYISIKQIYLTAATLQPYVETRLHTLYSLFVYRINTIVCSEFHGIVCIVFALFARYHRTLISNNIVCVLRHLIHDIRFTCALQVPAITISARCRDAESPTLITHPYLCRSQPPICSKYTLH